MCANKYKQKSNRGRIGQETDSDNSSLIWFSFLLLIRCQMSDSYSSRNGDAPSPSLNGYANTSNPSLVPSTQNGPTGAISPLIRKKLMGFVGFANLPNQVHRKSVRKGFQFTAMVVGQLHLISVSFLMSHYNLKVNLDLESRH